MVQIHIVSRSFPTTDFFLKKVLWPLLLLWVPKNPKRCEMICILSTAGKFTNWNKYFLHHQSISAESSSLFPTLKRTNFSETDFTDGTIAGVGLHIYKISCAFTYYFAMKTKQSRNIFLYFLHTNFIKHTLKRALEAFDYTAISLRVTVYLKW